MGCEKHREALSTHRGYYVPLELKASRVNLSLYKVVYTPIQSQGDYLMAPCWIIQLPLVPAWRQALTWSGSHLRRCAGSMPSLCLQRWPGIEPAFLSSHTEQLLFIHSLHKQLGRCAGFRGHSVSQPLPGNYQMFRVFWALSIPD